MDILFLNIPKHVKLSMFKVYLGIFYLLKVFILG
jgi:hypothetical protein